MGLFDRLFNFGDPTRDWPVVEGPPPAVHRRTMSLESLRFGEPLESARSLGRPDEFVWNSRKNQNCELLYAGKGLRLEFEGNRLVEVTFYIAAKSCPHPLFKSAQPKAPNGGVLTPEMDRKQVVELFGEPDEPGGDDLVISHDKTTSVFFFSEDGRLDRWELFLND
jgi:hypothetical protein